MLDTPERRDPEQAFAAPDEKAMACAITITTQVGSNRSVVVQTYLDRDADIGIYHSVFDKLNKVVDRQEAKLQIEGIEADLKRMRDNHNRLVTDFGAIEERAQETWEKRGKRGPFKLSDTEEAQKKQAMNNIEAGKANIANLEALLTKARGVVLDVE